MYQQYGGWEVEAVSLNWDKRVQRHTKIIWKEGEKLV